MTLQISRQKQAEAVTSVQESLQHMKMLLDTTIGSIVYLRCLFPEENFQPTSVGHVGVMKIKKDYSVEGDHLLEWMNGVMDAIENKYLKDMIFGIYLDPNEPERLAESYLFRFSYADGDARVSIDSDGKKLAEPVDASNLMKMTQEMLRRLIILTQTLKALPDDANLIMKLYYYDDVTPSDYEPPFFKPGDDKIFHFGLKPAEKVQIGHVKTPHHALRLQVQTVDEAIRPKEQDLKGLKSTRGQPENSNLPAMWSAEPDNDRMFTETNGESTQELIAQLKRGTTGETSNNRDTVRRRPEGDTQILTYGKTHRTSPGKQADTMEATELRQEVSSLILRSGASSMDIERLSDVVQPIVAKNGSFANLPQSMKSVMHPAVEAESAVEIASVAEGVDKSEFSSQRILSDDISCACGVNETDGNMIECGHCHTWGHMVCFGFLSPDDQKIPTEFLCYECRNKMHLENPAKYPNEYDPQAIRSLAIFRRALSAVWEEGLESVSWLAERLGVDTNEASGLLRKLQEEQFVSTQGQKKRGRKSKGKAANEEEETERHKVIKFKRCQIRLEKIMSESAFAEFLHEGSKTEGTSRGRAMPIVPEESDQLFPSIGSRIKERSIAGDANTNAFQNRVRKEASRAQQLAPDSSQPVDQVYTQSVLMTGGSIEKIEDTFQQSALNESNMDIDPVEPILKRKFLDELGLSCSQATGFDQGPDVKRRKASVVTHPLAVL